MLFVAAGVRTPLLALLAMRRLRNLALVLVPYGAGLLLIPLLSPALGDGERAGLLAVVIAPALLSAPALATALGGRMDRAGALLAGSLVASFLLALARAAPVGGVMQTAMLAFVVGVAVTSTIPMLPVAARMIIQRLGDVAFLALVAIAVTSGPALGPAAALAALAVVLVTVGAAAVVAALARVDIRSAVAGAGTRDPAVATALAMTLGGPAAGGIPLYDAALLLVLGAAVVAANRRKAR